MSRIGQTPIPVPDSVDVEVRNGLVKVTGPLGELEHRVWPRLDVEFDPEERQIIVRRHGNDRQSRSMHGLHRSLLSNNVEGVVEGYSKTLELYGMGYSVEVRGDTLVSQVGFCHPVEFEIPDGISVEVQESNAQNERPARFTVKGIDKEKVGQFAARIRDVRRPEPYQGKGFRYEGEHVRRKEGKAFAGLG